MLLSRSSSKHAIILRTFAWTFSGTARRTAAESPGANGVKKFWTGWHGSAQAYPQRRGMSGFGLRKRGTARGLTVTATLGSAHLPLGHRGCSASSSRELEMRSLTLCIPRRSVFSKAGTDCVYLLWREVAFAGECPHCLRTTLKATVVAVGTYL